MIGFNRHYGLALTYLNWLRKIATGPAAVVPEIYEGAVLVVLGDRLPENLCSGARDLAYQAYAKLDQLHTAHIDKMPMHRKGEVLAGLARTAFLTGREK